MDDEQQTGAGPMGPGRAFLAGGCGCLGLALVLGALAVAVGGWARMDAGGACCLFTVGGLIGLAVRTVYNKGRRDARPSAPTPRPGPDPDEAGDFARPDVIPRDYLSFDRPEMLAAGADWRPPPWLRLALALAGLAVAAVFLLTLLGLIARR